MNWTIAIAIVIAAELVNTAIIGAVDSVKIFMRSSDTGQFGMNTPGYYAIDNVTVSQPGAAGLEEMNGQVGINVYPNPCTSLVKIDLKTKPEQASGLQLQDVTGKVVYSVTSGETGQVLDLSGLPAGVYLLQVNTGAALVTKKIIKN